jgi:hypothetical protein
MDRGFRHTLKETLKTLIRQNDKHRFVSLTDEYRKFVILTNGHHFDEHRFTNMTNLP